jgi:hypothetical protein
MNKIPSSGGAMFDPSLGSPPDLVYGMMGSRSGPTRSQSSTKSQRSDGSVATDSSGAIDESQKTVVYWGTGGHRCRKHFFAHPETSDGWLSAFGHGAMLTDLQSLTDRVGKRTTRVTALEDSEVFVISRKDLLYFMELNPALQVKMHSKSVFIYAFDNVVSMKMEKMLIDFVTSGEIMSHPENVLFDAVGTLTSFGTDRLTSLVQNFSVEILHQGGLLQSFSSDRSLRILLQGKLESTVKDIKRVYSPWEWISDDLDSSVTEYLALEPCLYLLLPQSRLTLYLDVCEKNLSPSDLGSYVCGSNTVSTNTRGRVL